MGIALIKTLPRLTMKLSNYTDFLQDSTIVHWYRIKLYYIILTTTTTTNSMFV
jgi:hypothetical protein